MNRAIYFLLALPLVFASSCKKEDPQPATGITLGTPEFTLSGKIGDEDLTIQAGADNYFMATSTQLDENGVFNFIGELKTKGCSSGCPNSLKIAIKDYRQYANGATSKDSSIVKGNYVFATPSGTSSAFLQVFNASVDNGSFSTYNWDFGDGTTSTELLSTVSHVYTKPGIYDVSLSVETSEGYTSEITNKLICGGSDKYYSSFVESVNGNVVSFYPIHNAGIPPYTYSWDFGDGTTSTEYTPTHTYSAPGIYEVSLTVVDLFGTEGIIQRTNVVVNTTTDCAANIRGISQIKISNPLNLSGVIIEWTDSSGNVWTSNNNGQSGSSTFEILSVSDYISNENGQATKKIKVKASCMLFNGGESIVASDLLLDFAVACK